MSSTQIYSALLNNQSSFSAKNHLELDSSQTARTSRSLKNRMDILLMVYFPTAPADIDQIRRILQSLIRHFDSKYLLFLHQIIEFCLAES